ncbi:MAG: hypothetical protein JWP97_1706 [Labilithrix sp.]|nr:hypothetical protein [Labilithrix sp.]
MRKGLRASFVTLVCLVAACSDGGDAPAGPDAGTPPADSGCADGFTRNSEAEGGFCVETVADECGPGTRPRIGNAACVPVGWVGACPPGTEKDASGWGCIDLPAPAAACAGASRLSLAAAACVPVGDCNAPFPPAGAIVVDDDFTGAQLDGSHFRTVGEALAAAPSGATVAIAAGTYAEALTLSRPVSLVGRCPAEVTLTSPGGAVAGVTTTSGSAVTLRGLTMSGFAAGGVLVYAGATATIEDVVIEGAGGWGVIVDGSKATIRRAKLADPAPNAKGAAWGIAAGASSEVLAEDVTISGGTTGVYVASTGTKITLRGSLVSGQRPPASGAGERPRGASSVIGGLLVVERSVFRDLVADAGLLGDEGTIDATETIIHGVRVATGARGYGIATLAGGAVALHSSAIVDVESVGVFGKGGSITVEGTLIRGPAQSGAVPDAKFQVTSERSGIGLTLEGATATVDNSAIVDSWGYGAYATAKSTLTMRSSVIENTRGLLRKMAPSFSIGAGITSGDSSVVLEDVAVTHSVLGGITAGKNGKVTGSGVLVRDMAEGSPAPSGGGLQAGSGSSIELDGSAVTRVRALGVVAYSGAGSRVTLKRSTIHGVVQSVGEQYGHGVMVRDQALVELLGTAVFDNQVVGLGSSGGRARIAGSTFARNAVAVQAQDGSFLVESADAENAVGDGEVRVSPDSLFVGNGVKVGGGDIPLPAPLLP